MGITLKYSLLYYLFKEKLMKLFKIGEIEFQKKKRKIKVLRKFLNRL